MTARTFLLAVFVSLLLAPVAQAHHPGADLDKVMRSKEKFFQVIDNSSAPPFDLMDAAGKPVALSDHSTKVVVLYFIYTACPDICPLHAEKVAEIQEMINQTPMKAMVQFLSVTTDPVNDTPDILQAYGAAHGLDPTNWSFLTTRQEQQEDTTRVLAKSFGHKFVKTGDTYQVHNVVTHVIDQNGRWAANFHGLRFEPVNMVLYINGLINNANSPTKKPEPGWWDRLKSLLE